MTRVTYAITAHAYRGQQGFVLRSRGMPWNIAIFSTERPIVETIRQAYKDQDAGKITREEREHIEHEVLVR